MEHLEHIQTNLHQLLTELNKLRTQAISHLDARTTNIQNSPLLRTPRILLLLKIFPYLTWMQLLTLSACSNHLRKIIFSPIGMQIICFTHAKLSHIVIEVPSPHEYNINQHDLSNIEITPKITQQRQKIREELYSIHRVYTNLFEMKQALREQLRRQQSKTKKISMALQFAEASKKQFQKAYETHRQRLKQASSKFQLEITNFNNKISELEKETAKLNNQKVLLVKKIKQYQYQLDQIKKNSEKSKEVLRRIKGYLLNQQL